MNRLFKGYMKFRREDFASHRELFRQLSRSHDPHTLFIGCSDSRVVPNLITHTHPGELFIVRNVANIVPPYRKTEEYVSTTSAIEYAVLVLKVDTIVVCGHSNCGGCAAMNLSPEELEHIPHVRKWLELSKEVKGRVDRLVTEDTPEEREWLTEQVNILVQMRNLLTYPYVKEKYGRGELNIYGWHYIIETGEIFNFNDDLQEFQLLG
ncbi:MAG: carbonic anhydrase [Desulfuromonadales bacterium GWD2_61_12]|nr:MAG: carbonic anhydrase [Desulfuromonadales bacterium GWC2_61_20]OGR36304.1 MAG: carbonic anhydrase [Desulfuromonadales bacterium GWD2_61_12]HAD04605.1 carbonic anhydrase [Desulfuromonas sp.]HBT82969.1 carbonic anhydrase [Desulfuromonas sp.]